jgi:predicted dehydrogenase
MVNKVYRAAILGCGNIAGGYDLLAQDSSVWTHAKAYKENPAFSLSAVMDVNESVAKKFSENWRVPHFYSDLSEFFANEDFEMLSICSPNRFHYSHLKEAVKKSTLKAIICEKPLALRSTEASEMVSLCAEKGIVLVVNYFRRWDHSLNSLGGKIKAGHWGKVLRGRVIYTKGVFHNASHGINLMKSWLGECDVLRLDRSKELEEGEFLADFTLRFERGAEIDFLAWDSNLYNFMEIELFAERARIRLPMGNSIEVQEAQPSKMAAGEKTLSTPEIESSTVGKAIPNLLQNLVQVLEKKQPLQMLPEEALATIQVCEMIQQFSRR